MSNLSEKELSALNDLLSEEEKNELVDEINKICRSLCKHMGREHYTL